MALLRCIPDQLQVEGCSISEARRKTKSVENATFFRRDRPVRREFVIERGRLSRRKVMIGASNTEGISMGDEFHPFEWRCLVELWSLHCTRKVRESQRTVFNLISKMRRRLSFSASRYSCTVASLAVLS